MSKREDLDLQKPSPKRAKVTDYFKKSEAIVPKIDSSQENVFEKSSDTIDIATSKFFKMSIIFYAFFFQKVY